MPKTKLKTLILLDVLRQKTDALHPLSVPGLISELGARGVYAERKGIYRDLDALTEHGESIVKTATGYYLGDRMFTETELRLLIEAVQSSGFIDPRRSKALADRLLGTMSEYASESLRARCAAGCVKCRGDELMRAMETVGDAIGERRQISFSCSRRGFDGKRPAPPSGRFRASPYALVFSDNVCYLVCSVDGEEGLKLFRLDTMQRIRTEQHPWRHFSGVSEYRTRFDASGYARDRFAAFGDLSETRPVTLSCDNVMISEITDRFGPEAVTDRENGDRFRALVRVSVGEEFLAWASQWGALLEIVSPEDARAAMKERLDAAAALYQ